MLGAPWVGSCVALLLAVPGPITPAEIPLSWTGPVDRQQRLSLWLAPPWLNLLLALARVGLLLALTLLFVRRPVWLRRLQAPAVAALLLASGGAHAQTFPPKELLDELRAAVTAPPPCSPDCAGAGRLAIEATPDELRLRLEASAAAPAALPLPGGARHWLPAEVLVDGKPAVGLRRDGAGTLWVRLDPGGHQILLQGPLPARDVVQLPLPAAPRAVAASVRGWKLEGVGADGEVGDSLQLTRLERPAAGAGQALPPQSLPPLVRVTRTLQLGLRWEVETTVARVTRSGAPVVAEVPLLAGEAVVTDGVRVVRGGVPVNLGPDQESLTWRSNLEIRPELP